MRNTEEQSTLAMQIPSDTTSVVEAETLQEAKEDPSFQNMAFPVAEGLEKTGLSDEGDPEHQHITPDDEPIQYPGGGKLFPLASVDPWWSFVQGDR